MTLSRRQLLAGAAALVATPGSALAFGETTEVGIAELDIGTLSRPRAWASLLRELEDVTSVEARAASVRVAPDDPALFDYPFVALIGDKGFDMPSTEGLAQLSRYLAYGGFLFCDDTSGGLESGFYSSVQRLARVLYPTRAIAPLPETHAIHRSFFLIQTKQATYSAPWLGQPVGRVARHKHLEGLTVGNLAPLVLCRNDLSGALDRTPAHTPAHPCVPGGERQRREARKLGVNLLMYALTARYKLDQVHQAEYLELQRRGRR